LPFIEYVKETRYLTLYKRYKKQPQHIPDKYKSKVEPERLEKQLMI
jgi:hypothetical protein